MVKPARTLGKPRERTLLNIKELMKSVRTKVISVPIRRIVNGIDGKLMLNHYPQRVAVKSPALCVRVLWCAQQVVNFDVMPINGAIFQLTDIQWHLLLPL